MGFSRFGFLRFLFCCHVGDDEDYDRYYSYYRRANINHYVRSSSPTPSNNHSNQEDKSQYFHHNLHSRTKLKKEIQVSHNSKVPDLSTGSSHNNSINPSQSSSYLESKTSSSSSSSAALSKLCDQSSSVIRSSSQSSFRQPESSSSSTPSSSSLQPAISSSKSSQISPSPVLGNPLLTSSISTTKVPQESTNHFKSTLKASTTSSNLPQSSLSLKPLQSSSFSSSSKSSLSQSSTPLTNQLLHPINPYPLHPNKSTSSEPAQLSPSPLLANPLAPSSSKSSPQVSTKPSPPQSSPNISFQKLLPHHKYTRSKITTENKNQQGKSNQVCVKKDSLPSSRMVPKCSPLSPTSSSSLSSPSSSSNPSSKKLPPPFDHTPSKVSAKGRILEECDDCEWLEDNNSLPLHLIPEDIRDCIENGIVPEVLNEPLSRWTYKDYFAALLYAEQYYHEKWSDFELEDMALEFQEESICKKHNNHQNIYENEERDHKILVAFKINLKPDERPFLLSRDLVFVSSSGSTGVKQFEGSINRVVKSDLVLVEFQKEFYSQHRSASTYDISFSISGVCLKRAHQAVYDLSHSSFENFVFPDFNSPRKTIISSPTMKMSSHNQLDPDMSSAVRQILSIRGYPPYLVSGPRCVCEKKSSSHKPKPSKTGLVIQEAVIQIHKTMPTSRILICAPYNSACDVLMRGLIEAIPKSDMFRVNAAFREKEEVPGDILPSCLYIKDCFSCPSYEELSSFRVIFSTFITSFRLRNAGLSTGHFSHIFMVDASFAAEPDSMVPLSNFADDNTTVVVSGDPRISPRFVRSDIGRKKGLKVSYFKRLLEICRPYEEESLSPSFITELNADGDTFSYF